MQDLLFYFFAGLTLISALLVVANPYSRNAVTSAMFLVAAMVGLAGLFVLLNAFFLAALQVLVYAGAVMVLFLFVIMLLDLKEDDKRRANRFAVAVGLLAVGGIAILAVGALTRSEWVHQLPPPELVGSTRSLGELLFTRYLLPFEMLSVLLLVAMVGVILLSKKDVN